MSYRKIPEPGSYIRFDARAIFPRHMFLIQYNESKLISERLGKWFYEHTTTRTSNSPNAISEMGWTDDGTEMKFTSIERMLGRQNSHAPSLEIQAQNEKLIGFYAHLLRKSTLNDLYREILTKHGLSHSLPSPMPPISPLPGFDFIDEQK